MKKWREGGRKKANGKSRRGIEEKEDSFVLEREENQTLKEEGVKNGEERGASPLSSPIARLNSDHVYHVPPFVRHSEINSLFVYFESSIF